MKIKFLCFASIFIILSGCSNNKNSLSTSLYSSEVETIAYSEESTEKATDYSDILPHYDQLSEALSNALVNAHVTDFEKMDYENYEKRTDGDIDIDLILETNTCKLKTSCLYMSMISKWSIISIKNYDNGHYYYVTPSGASTVDLYSYSDDQLIAPQSTQCSTEDVVEHFNKELDSISESFDAALDDISKSYDSY